MNSFISEASFWVPELIVPSGWIEHAPFAFWLMDVDRPRTLVELGTHQGYSYFAFTQAIKQLGVETRCFAVDTWKGDDHAGYYGEEIFEQVRAHNDQHYWDFSELVRLTFDEAVNSFEDSTIDILHVDGRHFYEDVKHDFETWKPKLSQRGIVLLHDTNVRVQDFGVCRLWDELKKKYPHFEFPHGHGLGILGVGTLLPEALSALFACDEKTAAQVRQMYARLGGALSDRVELVRERDRAGGSAEQLSGAADELTRLSTELSRMTAERDKVWLEKNSVDIALGEAHTERSKVEAELSQSQAQIENLKSELFQSQAEAENLKSELSQTQAEAEYVKSKLSDVEMELDHLKPEISESRAAAERLTAELSASQASAEQLESDLSARKKEESHLRTSLSDLTADNDRMRAELMEQTAQLNRVLGSTSWRITSPIRWLSESTPRLKRLLRPPLRLLWWTITLQLAKRLQLRKRVKLVASSYLFDRAFYLQQNPDVRQAGIDPVYHYITRGASERRDPHPLFDTDWYVERNAGVSAENALVHYLLRGWMEKCDPHPLFDCAFYNKNNPDVVRAGLNPLIHYVTHGGFEKRDPHPLFQSAFYLENNPEVRQAGLNPLIHYITHGGFEGRNPDPQFDSAWYLEQNPDAATKGINPLVHYLVDGARHRRDPNPLFDTSFYVAEYPDVAASGINPLVHYALHGASEGRLPNKWFARGWPRVLPTVLGKEAWDEYGRNRLNALLSGRGELIFPSSESPEISIILVLHNKAHLTVLCLDSLLMNAGRNYELVIVDNNSTDDTDELLDLCIGARIVRNTHNLGFSEGANIGARESSGRYLLFLNNDTLLEPGAIKFALSNFQEDSIGAIGGKILLANGDLQEAGSMVWSDGSALGYGRGEAPDLPQYEFKRPVDYCSGAFLFTPRNLFRQLGGFDPLYAPAYYEDTDYCMKIWQAGLKVIYDPRCMIRHFESASSGGNESARPMMEVNLHKFVSRWEKKLGEHCPPSMNQVARARIARQSAGLRILYLDDRIPHRDLGAGFPRSNDIVRQLVKQGQHVTCAAIRFPLNALKTEYKDIPDEVELMDGARHSETLLRDYMSSADLVWISRPHNVAFFLDHVTELSGFSAKLVFDAEAIFSGRERMYLNVRHRRVPSGILDALLTKEVALAQAADAVVVVSAADQETMKQSGISNVHVLGHSLVARPSRASFDERHTFLFVGAVHGPETPNADSIRYFCDEIWPEVRRRTNAQLVIAGFGTDSALGNLNKEGVSILGRVEDLASVYNDARVFVAPTRYAAGIPYKVHEAAARGVPAVISQVLGRQLDWRNGTDVLIAQDAASFSNLCCELYTDEALWRKLQRNALTRVRSELSPASFADKIGSILASVGVEVGKARATCVS